MYYSKCNSFSTAHKLNPDKRWKGSTFSKDIKLHPKWKLVEKTSHNTLKMHYIALVAHKSKTSIRTVSHSSGGKKSLTAIRMNHVAMAAQKLRINTTKNHIK